jgi:FecR protein
MRSSPGTFAATHKEADMLQISAHTSTAFVSVLLLAAALPAQPADDPAPSVGVSKIRIVRLSEVKGVVQIDRDNGRGFEPAMANMPVVEKARLRTQQGVAEVEFEDNSTVRLAPNTEIEFPQLERTSAGATLSSVQVVKGTVYASMVKTKGNDFNLLFGARKLQLPPSAHVRLHMEDDAAKLAVLDGSVRVEDASGMQDVPKKKTIIFALQDQNSPEIAKDVDEAPFDSWDKESSEYHARSANYASAASSQYAGSPYAYGLNDMMYYGNFVNAGGGCGSMWRPYFASAAWDPYSNGAWAWYGGGAGYSWVSPYPWGWTPYHYGSWGYCPGTGWGWSPGGSWNGLNNRAMILSKPGTPANSGPRPAPVHPPGAGEPTVTPVNTRPLVLSGIASRDTFLFKSDSAGMGVPRATLGRLDKFSHQATEKGYAHTPVYITAPTPVASGMRPSNTMAPPTLHRGYAPSSDMEVPSNLGMSGRPSSYPSGPRPSPSMPSSAPMAPSAPSGGPSAPSAGRPR